MTGEALAAGDFVALRGRRWLAQGVAKHRRHGRVKLSCIKDSMNGKAWERPRKRLRAWWLSWIERCPPKAEVVSSNLAGFARYSK